MFKKLKLINSFMKGNQALYWGAILSVGISIVISFIIPIVIQVSIDSLIGNTVLEENSIQNKTIQFFGGRDYLSHRLWIVGLLIIILSGFQGIFTFLKGKWSAKASESIALRMRNRLYDHLQRLPFSYHSRVETGDLIQRCTSDVETVRRFLSMQVIEVFRSLMMLSGVIPIMLMLDVQMTIISMSVIPFIIMFSIIFFVKIKATFQLSDAAEGKMSSVLQENLTGVRVVKAFCKQNYEILKFDKKSIDYRDKTYKLIRLLAYYWSASDFLCMFQLAVVLLVGAYRASLGELSVGIIFAFVSYINSLLWPVRQMGRILTDMGKTFVSVGRIQEILDEKIEDYTEPNDENSIKKIYGDIEFKNVDFAYNKEIPVLKEISFKIKRGQTIAILGATGSGKSSLVSLLPRLYDYEKGSIKIDGVELKKISKKWIRKQIGIVLQEPFLYSKTILSNIKIAEMDIANQAVYDAADVASVHDVILGFEEGYETSVGERGVTLSGGQKQRIAMARTILQNPPILILDDSLSAVDIETDARIRNSLRKRRGKSTTLIISHRLTTISQADLILVMEAGKIIQQGNHQELLNQEGLYRRVWNIQNSLEEDMQDELDNEY